MKKLLEVLVVMVCCPVLGATASWTGICSDVWGLYSTEPLITDTTLKGVVRADDGTGATIRGLIFTRTEMDGTYIKAYDYSTSAVSVNTRWLLSYCGDVLAASTLLSFKNVELGGYLDCETGGDKIADPSDFYLAFVAEDWDDYISGAENPHIWYGWVNLAVNADGALDVLGSGINLDGGAVLVGVASPTPEPTGGLLLLVGLSALALRRHRRASGALPGPVTKKLEDYDECKATLKTFHTVQLSGIVK